MIGSDENSFVNFAIPSTALDEGTNMLAVEVHQASGSSSDLSFDLRLRGVQSNAADPLFLSDNGLLRARALDAGEWSALNEATFIVDAGVAREILFGDRDKETFHKILFKQIKFSALRVIAWCFMGNHFHLLLEILFPLVRRRSSLVVCND